MDEKLRKRIIRTIGESSYYEFREGLANIKKSDLETIKAFTGNEYLRIQKNLASKISDKHGRILKSIFTRMPKLKKKLIVYRVFSKDYVKPGKYPVYLSTSLTREAMMEHAKKLNRREICLTKVVIYPNVKIFPIFDLSQFKKEQEILVDRNMNIHIHALSAKNSLDAVVHIYPPNIKLSAEQKLSHSGGIQKNRELKKLKRAIHQHTT